MEAANESVANPAEMCVTTTSDASSFDARNVTDSVAVRIELFDTLIVTVTSWCRVEGLESSSGLAA